MSVKNVCVGILVGGFVVFTISNILLNNVLTDLITSKFNNHLINIYHKNNWFKKAIIFLTCPSFGQKFEDHPLGGRCLKNCRAGTKYSVPELKPNDISNNPCYCSKGWKTVDYKTFICE